MLKTTREGTPPPKKKHTRRVGVKREKKIGEEEKKEGQTIRKRLH